MLGISHSLVCMLVFHCGYYQGVALTAGQHYYEKQAVGRRVLPGDLFKTQQRRTALLDLWKASLPKCPRATICNLQTQAFSLKLTGFYSSHNKKPSSPVTPHFIPPPAQIWVLPCRDRSVGVSDKPYMKGPLNPFTRCGLAAAWCVVTDAGSQTPLLPLLRSAFSAGESEREWSHSGNLAARKNPSWVHSSSPLPLLCR